MNSIKSIQNRIENRLLETKKPCKLYKSEAQAEKVAEKLSREVADYFGTDWPVRYVIVFIESQNKYAAVFDVAELMSRRPLNSGSVMVIPEMGHYTF